MLKQLCVENFTVFPKAEFNFAPGLNVIVGENGTGKSHVLKLAYAVIAQTNELRKENPSYDPEVEHFDDGVADSAAPVQYIGKLKNVFRVSSIEKLARLQRNNNDDLFQLHLEFYDSACKLNLTYKHPSKVNEQADNLYKMAAINDCQPAKAIFFPTRELLTIYPGFVALYQARYLEFDETYRDTCLLLGEPLLRQPMNDLLSILEEAMGGKVELDNGRFYLITPEQGKLEMPLVAEGLRKLAMLAQLIAVGALEKGSYLFWDEPEANLNPRLIKVIAKVIQQLAQAGIQIFIATHSLFLLRELEVLQAATKTPVSQRYFSLKQGENGVEVEQGSTVEDLQTLVLLDEELLQSDRYLALD